VSGQLYSPTVLTPGRTPAPVEYVAMWAPDPLWTFFGEGKIFSPPGFEPDYYILGVLGGFQTAAYTTFK